MAPCFRTRLTRVGLAVIVVTTGLTTTTRTARGDDKPGARITRVAPGANVFADREVEFRVRVAADRPVRGRLSVRFAVGRATIAAKDADVAARPNAPAEVAVRVPVPPVKPGAALQARLTAAVTEPGRDAATAALDQDVWVFPDDPFAGRAEWL